MSGDWIKMRGNLWDDPRVGRICDLTSAKEATVIGALYWLWATADQHTEDGAMPGLSLQQIDRKTGVKGFAAALVDVGWLDPDPQGVVINNFEEHNGASAKKRCQTAKRVAAHRSGNDGETQERQSSNAPSVTSALAREEKRREEKREDETLAVVAVAIAPPKRGERLPTDWSLPKMWGDWALAKYPQWTAEKVRDEAMKFRNHWTALSGRSATKLDWLATWQNWCMSDLAHRGDSRMSLVAGGDVFAGAV